MSCSNFEEITDSILQLFPTEKVKSVYYSPSYTVQLEESTKTQKRYNSSGFLQKAYLSLRDHLVQLGLINSSLRAHPDNVPRKELDLSVLYEEESNDEELIVSTWKLSYSQRHNISFKGKSFSEIINRFTILKGTLGPKLILSDFDQKFENYKSNEDDQYKDIKLADRLLLNWKNIAPKIVAFAKITLKISKKISTKKSFAQCENDENAVDEQVQRMNINYMDLKQVLSNNNCVESIEHTSTLALLLLPALINYAFKSKKVEGIWKPKQGDIARSYIEHIEVPKNKDALTNFIESKYKYYVENNVTQTQPYIILCGPLHSVEASYVVVDTVFYKLDSPLRAVDFCFKLFYFMNIEYSTACPHIWSFLHKHIFEITGYKNTVASQKILNIVTELQKIIL